MEIFTIVCVYLGGVAISYMILQQCILGALKRFDDWKGEKDYQKTMEETRRASKSALCFFPVLFLLMCELN